MPTEEETKETTVAETREVLDTKSRYQTQEYARKYRSRYAGGVTPIKFLSRVIAAREIQVIRSLFREIDTRDAVVLDVPCGTGKLGAVFSEFPVRVMAADVSSSMMAVAREECRENQVIEYLRCDARDLPLEAKSVDVIVCLRLFQRLTAPARRAILEEFRRVGRRRLVISYSFDSVVQRNRRVLRRVLTRRNSTLVHVRLREIQAEIESAGFCIREMRHVLPTLSSEVVFLAEIPAESTTGAVLSN